MRLMIVSADDDENRMKSQQWCILYKSFWIKYATYSESTFSNHLKYNEHAKNKNSPQITYILVYSIIATIIPSFICISSTLICFFFIFSLRMLLNVIVSPFECYFFVCLYSSLGFDLIRLSDAMANYQCEISLILKYKFNGVQLITSNAN